MNKRKLLAFLMAIALLATLVSANLALPASATTASLIAGKLPVAVSGSSCTTSAAGAGSLADVTDGVLVADGGSFLKYTDWGGACSANLTYDLGDYYAVSSFMFEHGYKTATAGDYYDEFRVYVSANSGDVFNSANEVHYYKEAEKGGADAAVTVTLTESVVGRYVGIIVYGDAGGDFGVRLGEFAVYGEPYEAPAAPTSDSLLFGLTAGIGAGQNVSGDLANLTDGNIDTMVSSDTGSDNDGSAQFYYELDALYDINKVVISSNNEGANFHIYTGSVYVSDSLDTLWADANKVETFSYAQGEAERTLTFDFDTAVTGKYIGFKLGVNGDGWWYRVRVGELEAYGEEHTGDVPQGPTNLLSSLEATLGAGQTIRGGVVSNLTDGNPDTVFSSDTGSDADTDTRMSFSMDTVYAINKIVISSGNEGASFNLYDGDVYVSAYEDNLWKASSQVKTFTYTQGQAERVLTFEFTEPVIGQYIGFAFNVNGEGWWYCARVGELEAYGEEYTGEITESDGSAVITGGTVTAATTMPEGNLIANKGSSLTEGWQDYGDGVTKFTAQNVGRLTDGILSDGTGDTQTSFIDPGKACRIRVYYTLDNFTAIDKLFMDDGKKINDDFAIYVSKHPSTLYNESSRVFSYKGDKSKTPSRKEISLAAPVTGKYVAFELNAETGDYGASLAELGIYGSAQAGDVTNLVAGQKPVDVYISEVGMPDKYNEGAATYGYLNETDITDASMVLFTDGNHETRGSYTHQAMDGRECSSTLENRKKICADTPWSVLVYHLGGTATVDEIYLTSTSEGGYHWIGGADFYVGTTLATLFNAENRVYTSGGEKTTLDEYGKTILDPTADLPDRYSSVVLDEPREARYVALVVTRPTTTRSEGWSISRINEFEVFGTLLREDEKVNTLFTEDTFGCTLNLSQLNYDDVDFHQNIDHLEVTRTAYTLDKTSVDKWLMVDPEEAYVYSFTLHTKDGQVLDADDVGKRIIDVTIPNGSGHMQSLAKVQDGDPVRIVNARTENGQLIGESVVGSWNFTPIVFDDSDVIWSGIAAGNGTTGQAAGVTARADDAANWLWLLLPLLLVAAVGLAVAKRRRAQ